MLMNIDDNGSEAPMFLCALRALSAVPVQYSVANAPL